MESGATHQQQYHQWGKHQRKEKVAPKRKKGGAICRAMRQKAIAAPPITEIPPKRKTPNKAL